MSFRGILNRVAELRQSMADLNDDVDGFGQAVDEVARRRAEVPVFLVGADGKPLGAPNGQGPFSPTLAGSSVGGAAPTTAGSFGGTAQSFAGATAGSKRSSGGAGAPGGGSAGKSGGVQRKQTAREAIAAIVAAAGVQTPPADSWDPTGTSDGARAGQVIQYVVANGVNSPREYLVWCAGWLAYKAPDATVGSQGSRGPLGTRPGGDKFGDVRDRRAREYARRGIHGPQDWTGFGNIPIVFAGGAGAPGFSTQGGGAVGDVAAVQGSNFDTLVATTGKVTDAVTESGGQVVGAIRDLTREVQRGNSSTGLRAGGVL